MKIVKQQNKILGEATKFLNAGGVVVCPTDTVYGFLAVAGNKKAVNKIYKIKKRPKTKPLAVFVKDIKMAKELAEINEKQVKTIKAKWPGKYTFIIESTNILQTPGVCKNGTIALRIPKYKFLNSLLKKIDKPLAQTSVNISGQPVLNKIKDIETWLVKQNILIIDAGNLKKSKPSRVIDLTGQVLTRIR